ncbi:glycoside hydrolase family 32 protein [Arcicella rigui]|uniref:Glycoside hydrolase family 32 protein n=1 Tax=Arcicella rigui TaxID=797020 RepID=A0ABU5Q703_9BACT|nr:glycoside hydrolase family 32 protein [Arcicella rigui]MEA5138619.1 glycoside hydrolase family 32 protein [Arcicella rigui]
MSLKTIQNIAFALIMFALITPKVFGQNHDPSKVYKEQHRPLYHFSPSIGWMNDPNGMVYYKGEYHLFYQHYPNDNVWGPMHWGHTVSKDLVNWKNLPIALYPDSLGYIFSGSAVIDWKNTSGLGINNKPPMVAIFTYHNMEAEKAQRSDVESQGIAFSNDNGRTWIKYAKNPVIKNNGSRDFRDPKVFWDEKHQQWVMALAVQNHHEFWVSKNLKEWSNSGSFGKEWGNHSGVWECADLFPLKEGDVTKWVLIVNINPGLPNGGSGTQYFVGDFDGKTFILDEDQKPFVKNGHALWLDYGRDNYAGVTWSDIPKEDGRRILIGWMSNWDYANQVPTSAWRSACTLPRELTLKKTKNGYRVFANPVKEVGLLKDKSQVFTLKNQVVDGTKDLSSALKFSPKTSALNVTFEVTEAKTKFEIIMENSRGEFYALGYDAKKNEFFSDRTQSGKVNFSAKFAKNIHVTPRTSTDKTISLNIYFDVASAEMFADKGETVMTEIFFPNEDFSKLKIKSSNGSVKIKELKVQAIKGIW